MTNSKNPTLAPVSPSLRCASTAESATPEHAGRPAKPRAHVPQKKLCGKRKAKSAPRTKKRLRKRAVSRASTAAQKSKRTRRTPKAARPLANQFFPEEKVRMGDALRAEGLGERSVAKRYAEVVKKLSGDASEPGSVEKLLVDVLKECSRQLESTQEADRAAHDVPVIVQLVHTVRRPAREVLPALQIAAPPLDAPSPGAKSSDAAAES